MKDFLFRHSRRLTALAAIAILYFVARLPTLSETERRALASHFKFTRLCAPEIPSDRTQTARVVHRDLESLRSWISSLGAAVALNDLDGDGIDNDLCRVEPMHDDIIVSPVPGTGERFAAFELKPRLLPFDSRTMAPMGCVPADMNEDGLIDVLAYYWGRTPIAFIRKAGGGPLGADCFVEQEVVATVERWFTNAATFADLDGDLHVDLILCNYFPDGADILNPDSSEPQFMQDSMSRAYNGGRKHVLRWKDAHPADGAASGSAPGVTFEEISGLFDEQVDHGWALGVGAADLDGDGLPELYFAHDFGPDRLMYNRSAPGQIRFARLDGEKTIFDPNSKVLGRDSYKGMSVEFGDLNGDGLLDIYVSNIAKEFALEESHFAFVSTGQTAEMKAGIAPYRDRSESLGLSRSGWGWDTRLADFDNDGVLEAMQATGFLKGDGNDRWPELHELAMANDYFVHRPEAWAHFQPGWDLSGHEHNPFFVRAADGRYYDLAGELGLDDPFVSRGIATADVDGDGDLDFAVANQWEPSFVYRNDADTTGRSLSLRLNWPVSGGNATAKGRPAIGAQAFVHLPDGRVLVSYVDGGNGHSGKRSHEVHFGLGAVSPTTAVPVEIRWRDHDTVRVKRFSLLPGRHELALTSDAKETVRR